MKITLVVLGLLIPSSLDTGSYKHEAPLKSNIQVCEESAAFEHRVCMFGCIMGPHDRISSARQICHGKCAVDTNKNFTSCVFRSME